MTRIIDNREYLTTKDAAAALNTTVTRILMLLKTHALDGAEVAGEWYVAADSLACATAHGSDLKTVTGCASYCTSNGCGCK